MTFLISSFLAKQVFDAKPSQMTRKPSVRQQYVYEGP